MNKKFAKGDRIIIKLVNGDTYEGDFLNETNKLIEIVNTYHQETGNFINSVLRFYRIEVHSVYLLENKTNQTVDVSKQTVSIPNNNSILIPREEYDRLKDVANNYIYVKTDDRTYFEAVEQIANFESVGVFAIGSDKGRMGSISLIALSTWKQVYIFDLKNFRTKHFPVEITEILENNYIKKVVFNGGPLKDCLEYSHDIRMHNVFDIQVSFLLIHKNLHGKVPAKLKNIGECLTEYFNFPSSLLTTSMETLGESWEDRPLDEEKLKKLSRLTTYLITLKDHQLELMLKNYNTAVDEFHKTFLKSSSFEVLKKSTSQECSEDIDAIIPLELLSFKGK